MDGKKIVKTGYNTIAVEYSMNRCETSEDVVFLEELMRRLPQKANVLDAGCGAGIPITRLLSMSFNVTGVDFAEAQIALARNLVPQAEFVCQDMTQLDFPDKHFDAICSYYAIIHIPREEHTLLLLNFYRMLKPRGLLLVCMGADDLKNDVGEYFGTRMYWSHYDADTNMRLITRCGFNIMLSKIVPDCIHPESSHLFVLAKKK